MESSVEQPKYMRMSDWTQLLGVSIQTGHRWVRTGLFPKPIRMSPKCVVWERSVVEAWIQSRQGK
jgi:prophage regulatory protein